MHELAHNLLFLDECCGEHYVSYDVLEEPTKQAISAIRMTPRRLDLVVHSLVAAIEVLLARESWLGHPSEPKTHPPSSVLLANCYKLFRSIHEVSNWDRLVKERGIEIIYRCKEILNYYGYTDI